MRMKDGVLVMRVKEGTFVMRMKNGVLVMRVAETGLLPHIDAQSRSKTRNHEVIYCSRITP